MKKIFQRLIVFFVGIPVIIFLVVFLPHYRHLCFNLIVIAFSILGALEFRAILSHKNLLISIPEAAILGAISPTAWTVVVSLGIRGHIVPGAFILGASWLLVARVFATRDFDSYINRTTAGFAVMIYPGLFLAWIVQMAVFRNASTVILVFLLVALLNDAFAWCTGVLFGKNNSGFLAASPKKSAAGFAGGLFASLFTAIAAVFLVPDAFSSKVMPSVPAGVILGLGTGIAAILGDLGESALKRSAGVKDSGALVLGRGGILDSIDSLALAAPVYYLLYRFLF